MFNGRTHRAIGTVAGAGYALAKANQQAPSMSCWRSLAARSPGTSALGYRTCIALDAFTPASLPLLA